MELPAAHFLVELTGSPVHTNPTISEALEQYLRLKGSDKGKIFYQTAECNIKYVTKCLGSHCPTLKRFNKSASKQMTTFDG
jgi:hypothetical protein